MFTFTVTPDGGAPYEVTATSRDVLHWERITKGKTALSLAENGSMADLYSVCHLAAQRRGLYSGSRDEFEQTNDIEPHDDEEGDGEPDPTPPAHSTERSSPSRSRRASR